MSMRHSASLHAAALLYVCVLGAVSLRAAQDPATPPASLEHALPSAATGEQIYRQTQLSARAGVPTTGLLTATQYLKDNRLLPRGFDKTTAAAEIGVYGEATGDADFASGGDRVRYAIAVPESETHRVEVELRHQTIGSRWAHNLDGYDAPEPQRFVRYYRSPRAPRSSRQQPHSSPPIDTEVVPPLSRMD